MNNESGLPPKQSFGRAKPVAQDDGAPLDFDSLRGGGHDTSPKSPRWFGPVVLAAVILLFAGGFYFIHLTLAFKAAILTNVTAVYGPYPPFAAIFVAIPAACLIFCLILDFVRLKTGSDPFSTVRGIAAFAAGGTVLLILCYLPLSLIRHHDNRFAESHGYIRCSSPFDPHHIRVYALKNYVDDVGCPTVTLPQ
jgi:hypothetical protein